MKKLLAKIMIVVCLVSTIGSTWQFDAQAATYYDEKSQTIKLLVGDNYQIESKEPVVSWESSNPGIISVSDSGLVTAVAYGSNEITVTGTREDGTTETYTVRVLQDIMTDTEVTVKQFSDKAIFLHSSGYDVIDVSIDDDSIATCRKSSYNSYVEVDGLKAGETILRINTEIGEYTCKVIVKSILAFNREEYSLERGETKTLEVSSRFKTCVWENSDDSVAEMRLTSSQSQYEREIVAKKAGTTTITVTNEYGEVASTTFTVTETPFIPTMQKSSIAVGKKEVIELNTVYSWDECTYEFEDPSIAVLEDYGSSKTRKYVKALKVGDTVLRVTNKYGESVNVDIHVYAPYTTIEIDCDKVTVYLGRPEQLTYTAMPSNTNNRLTWRQWSGTEEYFTISENGVITPIKTSEDLSSWDSHVAIVAEDYASDDCEVVIKAPYFSESNYSIYKKKTLDLASKLTGGSDNITWTSSDPSIATVDAKGVVTGVQKGTVTITANSGGYELSTKVTVNNPKLSATSATLSLGKTKQLSVKGNTGAVKWNSSKSSVASVSSSGKVTAKKPGTATITATVDGLKLTCKVTVKAPTLNVSKKSLVERQTYTLKVNGSTGKKVWKSSNKSVATVSSSGKITAKKTGKATISVKVNGKTLKCNITVKKNQKTYSVNRDVMDYSYGSPTLVLQKVYYSGNSLKADVWVMNNRMFRASKFDWLNYELYDSNGKLIAKKKFKNIKLGIAPYGSKKITLTFSGSNLKKKNAILPNGVYDDWSFYYTYTY